MDFTNLTVCSCSSRNIMNREEMIKLVTVLTNAGYTVKIIPDLCKTAITDAGQMVDIASTAVVACYPRAVRSIFDTLGLKPKQIFDIRNHSCEQILNEMGLSQPAFFPEQPFPEFTPDDSQEAWNPVIDKERCTDCGKCYDFCLFGVYSMPDGKVKVSQPQNCKNNCPACARVCPSQAVIFPKYEKSPINGGLHNEEPVEIDTKILYNNALKYKLEERKAKVSLLKKN